MEIIKYEYHKFPVNEDNVVAVAGIGLKFENVFREISEALLLGCAKFIKNKFQTASEVLGFVSSQEASGQDTAATVKLLSVAHTLRVCPSCKNLESCLEQIKVGLKVASNYASPVWALLMLL